MSRLRLWSRRAPGSDITAGNRYRRQLDGGLTAIATVLGVRPDQTGIAHVHFALTVEGSFEGDPSNTRTLALRSFAETYREQIA